MGSGGVSAGEDQVSLVLLLPSSSLFVAVARIRRGDIARRLRGGAVALARGGLAAAATIEAVPRDIARRVCIGLGMRVFRGG